MAIATVELEDQDRRDERALKADFRQDRMLEREAWPEWHRVIKNCSDLLILTKALFKLNMLRSSQ